MRLSPPQVVERADPGTVMEVIRLRDKVGAREEQARRAQRTAAEAQEAVGRESAINQVLSSLELNTHAKLIMRALRRGLWSRWCGAQFPMVSYMCPSIAKLELHRCMSSQRKPLPFIRAKSIHTHVAFLSTFGVPLQGSQQDVDNARHRLLTVQGSLAEVSEENAGLKRELEGERIKTAAGSRRLADAVERHDDALAKIRLDSARLREQRDR